MSEDFKHLSEVVADAREAKGWTRRDLAFECRLSQATIHSLEGGTHEMTQNTYTKVERVFGWTAGSVAENLQGGSPTVDTSEDRPGIDDPIADGPAST